MQAPLPANEAARLNALCDYNILDTPSEQAFDDLTQLAAHICGTPIALIGLIDTDRQWFKSKLGVDVSETPRDLAFCAYTILQSEPLIVRDAAQDPRFADNLLVTSDPKIRFYAGAPLTTPKGYSVGTLCVIDYVPRECSPKQAQALQTLAHQVVAQLELQRKLADLKGSEKLFSRTCDQLEIQVKERTADLAKANQELQTEIIVAKRLEAERQQAEAQLRESKERLQHLIASSPAIIYSSKPTDDYGITFISENITAQLGYRAQDFTEDSRFWIDRVHPEDLPHVLTEFSHLVERKSQTYEYRFLHRDGTYRWIQDELKLVHDKGEATPEFLGCWQDITTRKQAEIELYKRDKLLRSVAKATNQLLTNTNFRSAIMKALATLGVAAAVDRVYIYENHPHPVTGESAMSMRFEWTQEAVAASINQPHWQNQPYRAFGMTRWYNALSMGKPIQGITRELPRAEQEILQRDDILSLLLVPILMDEYFWGYIGFDECHSERRWSQSEESILVAMAASIGGALKRERAEAQLLHNALHDPLTNLPNRALFIDRLGSALKRLERHPNYQFAVLFLDLDRFKVINDSLGHVIGDQLLIAIAVRLEVCLRPGDTIARLGGDEFAILLDDVQDLSNAIFVVERLQEKLNLPFSLGTAPPGLPQPEVPQGDRSRNGSWRGSLTASSHEVFTTASIGIVLSSSGNPARNPPQGGAHQQPQDLLRNADVAMYRAKSLGRARYEVFDTAMHTQAVALLKLETDLRRAIERQEFILHYQPIVQLETGTVTGFEALVRWQHPQRGLVSPTEFIPIAEETGLIIPLGQWVLREACGQLRTWQTENLELTPKTISVNLSSKQFQEPDLIEQIAQILQETGLEASRLKLEITENLLMKKSESVTTMLSQLQALGTQLCMDDFGTGYSSLSYLHRFPVSILKIDRSFIQAIGSRATVEKEGSPDGVSPLGVVGMPLDMSDENLAIVHTIIKLARTLRMDVIAEGIETAEQLLQLKALGCTYGQGYFFSKPVDGNTAAVLLQAQCLSQTTASH